MKRFFLPFLVTPLLLAGCNSVPVKQVAQNEPIQINNPSELKPIAITKVVGKMKRGADIGDVQGGLLCVFLGNLNWKSGGKVNLSSEELVDVFRDELETNGWPVVGSTDNLFEGYDVSGAEILVAAKVKEIHANICYPYSGLGDISSSKGAMRLAAEWQIYSPATKSIIATIETEGSTEVKDVQNGGQDSLLTNAFAIAVNNLLADEEFLSLVKRKDASAYVIDEGKRVAIPNKYVAYKSTQDVINKVKDSTVTIRVAGAHGSGFVIGDGTKILTNAHVVGQAKNVTVITEAGDSFQAEVVSVSKLRDVAVLKSPKKMKPLYIYSNKLAAGSEVYAIGSPLKEELSGTVTKGIISGYREIDGLKWIQSDVPISPGNSGGPLVDSKGRIVGISTAGYQYGGSQVGINLFIPIEEALKYGYLKLSHR